MRQPSSLEYSPEAHGAEHVGRLTWRKGPPNAACAECGTPFHAKPSRLARGNDRFCSRRCCGLAQRRRGDSDRYIAGSGVREHVRIVEKVLGQRLPYGWCIHHVNEQKRDNRPENLIACSSARAHRILHAHLELVRPLLETIGPVLIFNLDRLEIRNGLRLCSSCCTFVPHESFGPAKRSVDGLRGKCSTCRSMSDRVQRAARPRKPYDPSKHAHLPGSSNPASKLIEEDVAAIRAAVADGETQTSVATRFSVSQTTVSLIVLRKKWKHI